MSKWYTNIYRRNLVDMHINDTDEVYLSKFSATDYFNYLKEAKIEGPMIYIQSHTGLCNFPTKVSKRHAYFDKNPHEIKKIINLCKEDGMKVVGYYSLIFNNQAVYDHPEWEMVNADGTTWRDHGQRYGLCCPNNEEYRAFVVEQIKEIREEYDNLDGIFYDMPYWEVVCHCPSCQKKWKEISDKPLPTVVDWDDPTWKLFVKARQDWMGEFAQFVKEKTNEIIPEVTVEFNFAAVVGCDWVAGSTEVINEACEFTGGDLYGDLYNHSFTAKYYYGITKNQPFEYMTCRCNFNLREHTIQKNEDHLESEIMLSTLHHGASLIIDAIDPDGCLDHTVSKKLGKVFEKVEKYEKYMQNGKLYAEVAVFFDSKTQYKYRNLPDNKECTVKTCKTLIENHIPHHVIANYHLDELNKYQMILAPNLGDFNNDEVLKFIDYVKDGGTLYLSGYTDPRLLKEFFDAEIIGETHGDSKYPHIFKGYREVQCYITPTNEEFKKYLSEFNDKYPLPVTYKLPIVKHEKGEVCALMVYPFTDPDNNTEFATIHGNPPAYITDKPAIIQTNYGKGKVIYSSAILESDDRYNFKNIVANIIKGNIASKYDVEASKYVESIIFENGDETHINLFDLRSGDDITLREFVITLPNKDVEVTPLLDATFVKEDNVIKGTFKKYTSLLISKK